VLDLIERYDLSPEQVERIHVSTGKTQSLMLRNSRPKTGREAKFSMQFAMAAALVARRVGLSELADGFMVRPEVQAIFPRVSITTTTEGSAFAPVDAVEITTNAGRRCRAGRSNSRTSADHSIGHLCHGQH
jgi:2-methylcitrate dehydratase PrpD